MSFFLAHFDKIWFLKVMVALDHFESLAPKEKWFIMPEMATLAADLYRRPVDFSGETIGRSNTFFPFSPSFFNSSPIAFVLVDGYHFNLGLLKDSFA